MSIPTTNTPNGAGNDLYSKNEDVGKQETNIADVTELDPTQDLSGTVPGDNTKTEKGVTLLNSELIRDVGYVAIKLASVMRVPINAEITSTNNKEALQQLKNLLISKGAISAQDYINLKKQRLERESAGKDIDKDNNGLEDRNE